MSDLWVFGYGSLMWRPDFPFLERQKATVSGYHRAFCIKSTHYRGTAARPGLVLGLDRGRNCVGVAFRIASSEAASVVGYLRKRELIYGVYREAHIPALVHRNGVAETIVALTYIAERLHPAYAGCLPTAKQALIVRGAQGASGANLDYVINTIRHLRMLGIREAELERLIVLAGPVTARDKSELQARASVAALRRSDNRRKSLLPAVARADQRRFMYRARLSSQV